MQLDSIGDGNLVCWRMGDTIRAIQSQQAVTVPKQIVRDHHVSIDLLTSDDMQV